MVAYRDLLLKTLANDYHSIGRGWQVAMDPEHTGELVMDDFLMGLERLGLLKHDADDAELAKAEKLFHYLENKDTASVTLASLDRGLTDSSLDDLLVHLMVRY